MIEIPDGSIYLWCYTQGLKHVPFEDIEAACAAKGVTIRPKDRQNWVNGYMRSDRTTGVRPEYNVVFTEGKNYFTQELYQYPVNPTLSIGERTDCWVPCNAENKPMIKWSKGCFTLADAKAIRGCVYLGENMKDKHRIVIDCDGDHNGLHLDTIRFMSKYMDVTHCLMKPKLLREYGNVPAEMEELPASFHLTFLTDRSIPTQHFPKAHIDIVGNRNNSLRYWKNKIWNGVDPIWLTPEIWEDIKDFIERKENDGS